MKLKLILSLFITNFVAQAQLKITGVVLDEQKEPMPYVNVYFKGTNKGTITNSLGKFEIMAPKTRGRIEISFVGYKTKTIRFNPRKRFFTIYLEEENNTLDEVIIVARPKKRLKKKENPAYRILKEIWKKKRKNGLKQVSAYQYKKLQTTEIGLNNLDSVFLKKVFKKDYKKVISHLLFNEDGINYYVPIYITETVTNVYGNNKKNIERQDIEAQKNNGLHKQGFIFDRISNIFNDIDIHQNNVVILRKNFVSPISRYGFETYDYVLNDSTVVNNKKLYSIYFFPRRDGDLAFEGHFWVADKVFSIAKIKMKIHKDINLNFVRNLSFEKEYTIKDNGIYLQKKNVYEGDFTLMDKNENNKGLTIKRINYFSDYKFDKVLSNSFYAERIVKFKSKQFDKTKSYWDSISSGNIRRKETYELLKIVKSKKKIKRITNILNTISTGYIDIGSSFQFGRFWNVFDKNSVEGLKIKAGFRTFKSSEDRFRLSGFVGYGIKDERYKFGIRTKYLLSYRPRIIFEASYLNGIEQLGGTLLRTNELDQSALFSRGENFFLSFVNKTSLKFDVEVKKNLYIGISGTHNNIRSASPTDFSINYLNEIGEEKSRVTDISTDIYISYAPRKPIYGFGVEQKTNKGLYSSLLINYRRGHKGLFNGSFSYDKIQFRYRQPILLGKIGILKTTINAGKTFGKVPIVLLSPIPANQTYWLVKNTFSLINYYDFVTDTYISGNFEHYFNGLIFNKLPFIKKLKLRSLLTFKTAYGTISEENKAINRSNIKYDAPTDKLYYEYGVGLENIGYGNVRLIRVDFIWRGDHKSINGLPSPKFAVRVGIKADF